MANKKTHVLPDKSIITTETREGGNRITSHTKGAADAPTAAPLVGGTPNALRGDEDTTPTPSPIAVAKKAYGSAKRAPGAPDFTDPKVRADLADSLRRSIAADNAPSENVVQYMQFFTRMREAGRAAKIAGLTGYSKSNMFLLALQEQMNHEVHRGLYAGPNQWEKLGREVKEDAVPKVIWAPVPPPKGKQQKEADPAATAEQAPVQDAEAQPKERKPSRYPFRLVHVYDLTDTTGEEIPDWAVPLHVGSEDAYQALVDSSPVPIRFADLTGAGEHGHLSSSGIVVDTAQPAGNRLTTLIHELSHHHLDHLNRLRGDMTGQERAVCEQEAALSELLVMQSLGLGEEVGNDVTTAAVDYLRSWSAKGESVAGHKARIELLQERLETAWGAAEKILDHISEHLSQQAAAA